MKGLAKKIVAATLVKLATYVYVKLPRGSGANWPLGVVAETQRWAVADSVDYAESRMARALVLGDLQHFRKYAFGSRSIVGLILEFGVCSGRSINYFASLTHEQIYGFDSFEGLHEDCVGWSFAK
jgi:hypothetical protein